MRVLQVAPSIALDQGGPSVFAVRLHEALLRADVESTLLATDWASGNSRLSPDAIAATDASVVVSPGSWPSRLRHSRDMARELAQRASDADIIHVDGFYLSPIALAYRAAVRSNRPFVLMPHGSFEPFQLNRSRPIKGAYDVVVGRRIRHAAAGYVFTAESERSGAAPLLDARAPTAVVQLGAATNAPEPIGSVDAWLGDTSRERVVLFLGRLARKKQPRMLLEAWSHARRAGGKRACLLVAGPDDEHSVGEIQELAATHGVDESVRVLGPVTQSQSSWLYGRSGVFALPTLNENFGMTIAEAMLHGCFVITTDAAAASVHVKLAGSGAILRDPDVDSLSTQLRVALASAERVRAGGDAGRRYASQHLSWDSTARQLVAFYEQLLSGYR